MVNKLNKKTIFSGLIMSKKFDNEWTEEVVTAICSNRWMLGVLDINTDLM